MVLLQKQVIQGANVSIYNGGYNYLLRSAFAGAATDRLASGATYYGIMEMSGNVLEGCVYHPLSSRKK